MGKGGQQDFGDRIAIGGTGERDGGRREGVHKVTVRWWDGAEAAATLVESVGVGDWTMAVGQAAQEAERASDHEGQVLSLSIQNRDTRSSRAPQRSQLHAAPGADRKT